ncbi:Sec63-domain-containing protein [Multifurca ochricompacta]|uniref:Sec63-domain-containing protein n=1 Tax=Multifurca ochricompacta TaxID=376703 RepID=A0AAD4QSB2_9AGAM|nr:Sec63-domain-containing protein [Multifurca ochricompacta]
MSHLHAVLASPASNETISEELSDMIGYDDMDVIVEIIENRSLVAAETDVMFLVSSSRSFNSSGPGLAHADAKRRMEESFRRNAERPLFVEPKMAAPAILPHVYSSSTSQGNILSQTGQKFTLPVGTTRHAQDYYEEVVVPPARNVPPRATERVIPVSELDDLARQSFSGYSSLNRMQSIIYPTAYGSNENMLLQPAQYVVYRLIANTPPSHQHRAHSTHSKSDSLPASIRRNDFKIIYVAPMKALAAEIVKKFSKRLQWLAIHVRELTGDMQLTKSEIAETQIIVTTPEKWDVVTRKPTGEGEIASKLKLLIIDEVHLLNEERGAVIETIVARTLRQVESSQSVIRIVGLSATLPNYIDVADFLRFGFKYLYGTAKLTRNSVSRQTGLFYFDSSFRPVPLEQHFIGVKGKPGSPQSKMNLDLVTFEKVSELVRAGHQVMVFVHARKETVKAALALRETASKDGILHDFSCEDHPNYGHFRSQIGTSRNKEMKQLFDDGFGIHHAGMLRADRTMMEKMFNARASRFYVAPPPLPGESICRPCRSALATVKMAQAHPAYTCSVVIKGTQVYDSSRGSVVDLSILDVLQVFGRAGRPGFETSGEGYICTTEDKLQHYLDAVTSQVCIIRFHLYFFVVTLCAESIESQFVKGMINAMNAEISLGTVATVRDAIRWLGYTYLFVRMQKTPLIYDNKRNQLVLDAARSLVEARMINFDEGSGSFTITDLGRLAAKYYIHHRSIVIFNQELRGQMTEADVLSMVSLSTEFDQIQVRENETEELTALLDMAPCAIKNAFENISGKVRTSGENSRNQPGKANDEPEVLFTRQGKVNVLLQGYISWTLVEDFALVSDMQYVAQTLGAFAVLMGMSKAIEKRLWPFDQPLKQFNLKQDVLYGLELYADSYTVSELVRMSPAELGNLVHLNEAHGQAILDAAKQFPAVQVSYSMRPLGPDVLKIDTHVRRAFSWSSRHGSVEPFWLWVEDHEGRGILQLSYLLLRQSMDVSDFSFVLSIPEGRVPPFVTIRSVSERWMGAEDEVKVPFDDLVMPARSNSHTPRLNLPFLPLSVLQDHVVAELFSAKLRNLNAIQTQTFWSTVNTASNSLICAPTGSGKSTLGHILSCETLARISEDGYVLIVAPRLAIVKEWIRELRGVVAVMGVSMGFVKGSGTLAPARSKEIRLTTSVHLAAALSEEKGFAKSYLGLRLIILENLEQLDPYYELAVSSLLRVVQTQPTRVVGFSSSLNDSADLAAWLDVAPSAFHSLRPSDRDQSLDVVAHTFAIPHSAALFKAMVRPASAAILSARPGPAIVFVPSRTQCSSVALDLIVSCTLETGAETGYLPPDASVEFLQPYLHGLRDRGLSDFISKGVGLFHYGIDKQDRAAILELYTEGIIQVLVVAREACWTLPVRAAVVVVMGTQYVTIHEDGSSRQLRDYSLEELVRMQGRAVRHGHTGHFLLFCQVEDKDTYMRFLEGGLPLESRLLGSDQLRQWYKHHRDQKHIENKQEGIQALSWTFLARRIASNPTYYDSTGTRDERLSRIVDELDGLQTIRKDGPSVDDTIAAAEQR